MRTKGMSVPLMLWEIVLQLAGLVGLGMIFFGAFLDNGEMWRWGVTILIIQIASDTNRRF